MKKFSKYLMSAATVTALALSTGAFLKVYAAEAPASVVAGQPVDLTYAAEKSLPSVVHIKYVQNSKTKTVEVQDDPWGGFFDPFGFFGNPGGGSRQQRVQTPKREATGSGVIISQDGYIVTNNHVVEGADELTVTLNDNREFSAKIIGTDKQTDLALIKVNAKDLPAITIANSDDLKVGEWVLAVGNPYNLNNTVTAGIVSAKSRGLGASANGIESFIQTDAAINPGNSGGALVNTRGELVGINAMLYSQTGSFTGYGFAIPTTIMNKVVADIKKYGSVQRVQLGITGTDVLNHINRQKDQGKEIDLGTNDGVYVNSVSEDGNGAEAGLEEGDVITKVDGKPIVKMSELQEMINAKRPGDKITLTYLRNKKKIEKTITLKNAQGNTKPIEQADIDVLGAQFRPVTKAMMEQLNINYGLEVIKVNSGALKDAGSNRGFIIQRVNEGMVKTIDDLQKEVKKASVSKDPVLYIQGMYPTGKKAYFAVPIGE
uniref:Do family serine endopeptidase n=1 Tax=Prevotella sp. TaxID=59823 RepID=UPI003FED7A84